MFNIKDIPRDGHTDACTDVHIYVHLDIHMTTKNFEIDGLPNFLLKV